MKDEDQGLFAKYVVEHFIYLFFGMTLTFCPVISPAPTCTDSCLEERQGIHLMVDILNMFCLNS